MHWDCPAYWTKYLHHTRPLVDFLYLAFVDQRNVVVAQEKTSSLINRYMSMNRPHMGPVKCSHL